jgi:hypothetical protein
VCEPCGTRVDRRRLLELRCSGRALCRSRQPLQSTGAGGKGGDKRGATRRWHPIAAPPHRREGSRRRLCHARPICQLGRAPPAATVPQRVFLVVGRLRPASLRAGKLARHRPSRLRPALQDGGLRMKERLRFFLRLSSQMNSAATGTTLAKPLATALRGRRAGRNRCRGCGRRAPTGAKSSLSKTLPRAPALLSG